MRTILKVSGILLAVGLVGIAVAADDGGLDAISSIESLSGSYIAPVNALMFRMRQPDGTIREYERSWLKPLKIKGPDGWSGRIKGGRIMLHSGKKSHGPSLGLVFSDGKLEQVSRNGKEHVFSKPEAFPLSAEIGSLWTAAPELTDDLRRKFDAWQGKNRLRLGFVNPNRAALLFIQIALLALSVLLMRNPRRKWFCVAGGAVLLTAIVLLLLTGSRAGLVALFAGVGVLLFFRVRTGGMNRRLVLSGAGVLLVALVLALVSGSGILKRMSSLNRGDEVRFRIWKTAPVMMVDAPGGWGFESSGRAYYDWYQPVEDNFMAGALVNDHLTKMVSYSWFLRFGWVFLWLGLIAVLLRFALSGKSPVPLAIWSSFGIAAWFNSVVGSPTLWIIPLLAVAFFLASRPWKFWRGYVLPIAGASVLSAVIVGAFYWVGTSVRRPTVPLFVEKARVCVNGPAPQIWIVNDESVLGEGIVEREIRLFYLSNPHAPAVGFVQKIEDLPEQGVRKLVLAGVQGARFMSDWMDRSEKEKYRLPKSVLFISPPFPAAALPFDFLAKSRAEVLVGEFAARLDPSYAKPPVWAKVIPAAELYIPGWMEHVIRP